MASAARGSLTRGRTARAPGPTRYTASRNRERSGGNGGEKEVGPEEDERTEEGPEEDRRTEEGPEEDGRTEEGGPEEDRRTEEGPEEDGRTEEGGPEEDRRTEEGIRAHRNAAKEQPTAQEWQSSQEVRGAQPLLALRAGRHELDHGCTRPPAATPAV